MSYQTSLEGRAWGRHRKRSVFFHKPQSGDYCFYYYNFILFSVLNNILKVIPPKYCVFPLPTPDLLWHKAIQKANSALWSTGKVYDSLQKPRDTCELQGTGWIWCLFCMAGEEKGGCPFPSPSHRCSHFHLFHLTCKEGNLHFSPPIYKEAAPSLRTETNLLFHWMGTLKIAEAGELVVEIPKYEHWMGTLDLFQCAHLVQGSKDGDSLSSDFCKGRFCKGHKRVLARALSLCLPGSKK